MMQPGKFIQFRLVAVAATPGRLLVLLLLVVSGIVYLPYLANPLIFDDLNVIQNTRFLDYAIDVRLEPRWLPYATLAHSYLLSEGSIQAMRLGNWGLHCATTIAVFVLLYDLYAVSVGKGLAPGRFDDAKGLTVAATGALLFAVHPIAVYGVGYLIQRSIQMSTLFALLMLVAYLRWLITNRRPLWISSVACYALSLLCKEHSIMAPAAALCLTFVVHKPSLALLRRIALIFISYAVVALLMISMVKGVIGTAYEPLATEMLKDAAKVDVQTSYLQSVVTQTKLYFSYLFLWVIPKTDWMSVDMRVPLAPSAFARSYALALFAFVGYPVVALMLVFRSGPTAMAGWLLLFPWLMFLTELSTVRVQEPFVLYRAYLWFPLFGGLVALVLYRLQRQYLVAVGVPILCILIALSWNRLTTFSDPLLLWEDAAKLLHNTDESGAGRIYYNRALALSAKGRKQEALQDLDNALALHPNLDQVYFARARLLFEVKRYPEALYDLDTAISINRQNAGYYSARAQIKQRMGHDEAALADLRTSCDLKDLLGCHALERASKNRGTALR